MTTAATHGATTQPVVGQPGSVVDHAVQVLRENVTRPPDRRPAPSAQYFIDAAEAYALSITDPVLHARADIYTLALRLRYAKSDRERGEIIRAHDRAHKLGHAPPVVRPPGVPPVPRPPGVPPVPRPPGVPPVAPGICLTPEGREQERLRREEIVAEVALAELIRYTEARTEAATLVMHPGSAWAYRAAEDLLFTIPLVARTARVLMDIAYIKTRFPR